jgi:dihydroflavonol-4-reductase
MPIGPHDHNLTPPTAMLRQFLHGRVQMYLDFIVNMVDVRDVATGLILAMERGQIGHRYILGGESISLKKILKLMTTISGRHMLAIPIPGKVAEIAAGLLESIADHVTHRQPPGTAEGVRIALRATELSIEKSQNELGYAPRSIEPALRDTIAYLLRKPDLA